jgi:hypothetical protein
VLRLNRRRAADSAGRSGGTVTAGWRRPDAIG